MEASLIFGLLQVAGAKVMESGSAEELKQELEATKETLGKELAELIAPQLPQVAREVRRLTMSPESQMQLDVQTMLAGMAVFLRKAAPGAGIVLANLAQWFKLRPFDPDYTKLFIICGPEGAGKTAVVTALAQLLTQAKCDLVFRDTSEGTAPFFVVPEGKRLVLALSHTTDLAELSDAVPHKIVQLLGPELGTSGVYVAPKYVQQYKNNPKAIQYATTVWKGLRGVHVNWIARPMSDTQHTMNHAELRTRFDKVESQLQAIVDFLKLLKPQSSCKADFCMDQIDDGSYCTKHTCPHCQSVKKESESTCATCNAHAETGAQEAEAAADA
eukprot:NODE_2182_length_1119_cov_116.833669_g2164_i0.p1 GENE.NODE_2182_length_1119_cov_116.833669_g2164_i0~~NODE_2182_length_1119_cov_116.833669_g2164_i0.p1  ORF type:complete len:329 (+),score=34.17 NODE_2182_length_1119_cov_116.833669_g2164_i0:91-1077(+)